MKIAKKLLAAVVAVMLVLSLSVCAFATQSADTGRVKIESDWVVDSYGSIAVKVYFVDAVDLQSWDLVLEYDDSIFAYADKEAGADAAQVDNCKADLNTFTDESNSGVPGEIKVGGYFKAVLWTAEEFLENSARGKQCIVNDEKFEATIFYLDVVDAVKFESEDTTISIAGKMTFGKKAAEGEESTQISTDVSDAITHDVEEPTTLPDEPTTLPDEPTTLPDETTTLPDETTTLPEETTTEVNATRLPVEDDDDDCRPGKPGHENCKPNKPVCKPHHKPGKPHHKHPNTGDSAALAAAAGVVLLAGAAFVVSKKRK